MGPNLYYELLEEPHDNEVVSTIRTDLPRTFPDNIFFNQSQQCEQRNQLYRVLCAYAHHNKHVGYCQVWYLSPPRLPNVNNVKVNTICYWQCNAPFSL